MFIAERLKTARKECKLTQKQVADVLGVDRSTYSYYELGHLKPSVEILVKLSSVFNVDIAWLAGADRNSECMNSEDYGISLIRAAKDKNMAELSRTERKFVALLRAAMAIDKDRDIFELLMSVIECDDDDE